MKPNACTSPLGQFLSGPTLSSQQQRSEIHSGLPVRFPRSDLPIRSLFCIRAKHKTTNRNTYKKYQLKKDTELPRQIFCPSTYMLPTQGPYGRWSLIGHWPQRGIYQPSHTFNPPKEEISCIFSISDDGPNKFPAYLDYLHQLNDHNSASAHGTL